MSWKISTNEKKNVRETETFSKDGNTITHTTSFRWGWVVVGEDPEIEEPEKNDSLVVTDFDIEDQCYEDSCWEEWDFGSLSEDEIGLFLQQWEDDWYEGLGAIGWQHTDTEIVFAGPLEIEQLDDDDSSEPEEEQPIATSKKWPFGND